MRIARVRCSLSPCTLRSMLQVTPSHVQIFMLISESTRCFDTALYFLKKTGRHRTFFNAKSRVWCLFWTGQHKRGRSRPDCSPDARRLFSRGWLKSEAMTQRGSCVPSLNNTAVLSQTQDVRRAHCQVLMLPECRPGHLGAKNRPRSLGNSFRDDLSPFHATFRFRGGAPTRARTGTRLATAKPRGGPR